MKFYKIQPNNSNVYNCFYIERAGDSSITFCVNTDDLPAIRSDFSNIESLTVYDKNNNVDYITDVFNTIKDIRVFFEYYKDEDTGEWLPGIQVVLKSIDLESKIRDLESQNSDLNQQLSELLSWKKGLEINN